LQGEDPERFELIQRLALVQKRMIYGMASKQKSTEDDDRRLAVHSAPPSAFSAAEMLFQLRHSQKQVKVRGFSYYVGVKTSHLYKLVLSYVNFF
jgi:hypothetical protein